MQEAMSDWTLPDPRPNWAVIVASGPGRKVAIRWTGYATDEDEARKAALRIAGIARAIAARLDGAPAGPVNDEAISCEDTGDTRPSIAIGSDITIETYIPERRSLRRTSTLSGRAIAAMEALFDWAAAHPQIDPRHVAVCEACRVSPSAGLAENVLGYAIAVQTDHGDGNPRMSEALREALSACSIAHWMAGGPEPKGPAPQIRVAASASGRAAQRAELVARRYENARLAIRFLDDLGLYDIGEAIAREHGDV